MTTRHTLMTTVLGLLLALPAHANAASGPLRLSLRDALRRAVQRHVNVIIANERIQQAMARLGQARSVLLPQISAGVSETHQTRNLESSGISLPGREPLVGPFNAFDARIRLTQVLFDASALERFQAARAGRQLSLAESDKARQDVLALVAVLYLEAARAAEALEVTHAVLDLDEERVRIARLNRDLGTGSSLALDEAQAALDASRHRWSAAVAEATERRLDVAAAVGLSPNEPVVFVSEPSDHAVPLLSDQTVGAALAGHPDITVARMAVDEQKAERAAERASFLPTASAEADYGVNGRRPDDTEQTYSFGAQVSLPVFDGGLRAARIREASSRVREGEAHLDDAQRQVEAKILEASAAIDAADALVRATDASLGVALSQLILARHRLQTGLGSDLDVLEALTQVAQARNERDEAAAAQQISRVNVAHAMGRMEQLLAPETLR